MQKINNIKEIKSWVEVEKSKGKTIAFVPTMGGLHAGHLSLVELAKKKADRVVVSIYVNPTQFAKNEDFQRYPRPLEADLTVLSGRADVVFLPDTGQIYPHGLTTFDVGNLGLILCGRSRPHFFFGVAEVVKRLFEIVRPDVAVFGQKDYQQLIIIKRMVVDLGLAIKVESGAIIREKNGLAVSTRNAYLSANERKIGAQLQKILQQLRDDKLSKAQAENALEKYFKVDYLEILDADTLEKISDNSRQIAILSAVYLGSTRLIDNIIF